MIILILLIVMLGLFLYLERHKIILKCYRFIDPVTGKDLKDLGYKLVFVKENNKFLDLYKNDIAVIGDPNKLDLENIVYLDKPHYYRFWKITQINKERQLVTLKRKDSDILVDFPISYISGIVVGKEHL